jgi:putative peptide zinc metalloprotease protein
MLSEKDETYDATYFVIPLSVQKEGDSYYVGNAELDEFYQFPEEGLKIIQMLQNGASIGAIEAALAEQSDESFDVREFVDTLLEIGFIHPQAERHKFQESVAAIRSADKRLLFRANPRIARMVFSWPSLALYLGVLGYALYSAVQDPQLRLNFEAFYLERNLTLTLVVLLFMYAFTASLHELGHMLAAARQGVDSRLGFSNRMWDIVAEADMTGLLALPRQKRYLPMAAGMLVDILSIATITLILKWLFANDQNGFAVQLLQALALQITISITWQFNIFLRTDVYYLVCNYFGYADLNAQAYHFYQNQLHAFSFGLLGKRTEPLKPQQIIIARTFFAIWLLGRIASIAFLVLILIPTLYRYFQRAVDAYHNPYMPAGVAIDIAVFATISTIILLIGLFMWIKPLFSAKQSQT